MNRIEREKKTVKQMVEIYCRSKHSYDGGKELCQECSAALRHLFGL